MPDWKLLGLYALWVIASGAMAVVFAGFLGFAVNGIGLGSSVAQTVFAIAAAGAFVVLVSLPYLLTRRR